MKLVPGKVGVEEDDKNPQQGGGGAAGVHIFLQSCGAGSVALRLVELGAYPPHGKGLGGVPGPGDATADGRAPAAET